MEKFQLSLAASPIHTEIFFCKNLFESPILAQCCESYAKRGAIVSDGMIAKRYGVPLRQALAKENLEFDLIPFPGSERSKSRAVKESLEDELLKRKLGRESLLIALGGGVTTDLVGYFASTYMRGVPLILVPTTLMAMVDSAIGGKTGVNTPYGKNQIGTFYFPKAIFIDPELLSTLPDKEWMNGLAEILKYGLISKEQMWKQLEEIPHWREGAILEELIRGSVQAKMEVVEKDPYEQSGYRRTLNFGHTVGHALELIARYELSHGEAVAIGCMAESYLSHLLGYLSEGSLERILKLYRKFRFPLKLPKNFSASTFKESLLLDKKSQSGEARFVLIDRIGRCIPFDGAYCRPVKKKDLDAMIDWMQNNFVKNNG